MAKSTTNNSRLRFCELIPLSDTITEVIADRNIEIDIDDVNTYHDWLSRHHDGDIAVLVNKKNHYSYTFDAQREINNLEEMKAIAYVIYDHATELALRGLLKIKSRRKIPYYISYDYDEALNWLKLQMLTA